MLTQPIVDIARFAYANAFEFAPRDFATGGISPFPWIFPQSDLRRRADSRWTLPKIFSFYFVWTTYAYITPRFL